MTGCPFGCHPVLRGPWIPAFAGKTKIILPRAAPFRFPRESGGPGTAVVPLPRNGPQRSGLSAGRRSGSCPFRFPRGSGGLGTAVVRSEERRVGREGSGGEWRE